MTKIKIGISMRKHMIFIKIIVLFLGGYKALGEQQMKIIDYKFYISELTRAEFATKNMPIETAISEVTRGLEAAVNKVMMASDPPMHIKWNLIEQTEVIKDADLEKCGAGMVQLSRILHEYFYNDTDTSTIAMIHCGSDLYVDMFKSAGLYSPYVTHTISTYCTTRTLIFFEPENDKFTSMYGTALLKAAGVRHPNPLKLEEVTNGDTGKELVVTLHDEAMKQLRETSCYRY